VIQDKPLRFVPKCRRCGRAKNQHRAGTLECPIGTRAPIGYLGFASQRFLAPDESESEATPVQAAD